MHHVLFVLADDEGNNLSGDAYMARANTIEWLETNGFSGDGGFFCRPPADYYAIGGRWTGQLNEWRLEHENPSKWREMQMQIDANRDEHGFTPNKERQRIIRDFYGDDKRAEPLIERLDPAPHLKGHTEADSQIVDAVLFAKIREMMQIGVAFEPEDIHAVTIKKNIIVDSDTPYDPIMPDIVGTHWITVVDWHS